MCREMCLELILGRRFAESSYLSAILLILKEIEGLFAEQLFVTKTHPSFPLL